jgi:hypothetical protein
MTNISRCWEARTVDASAHGGRHPALKPARTWSPPRTTSAATRPKPSAFPTKRFRQLKSRAGTGLAKIGDRPIADSYRIVFEYAVPVPPVPPFPHQVPDAYAPRA